MFAQLRRQPWPLIVFGDLRPRLFKQAAVGYTRRASGLAVQTPEAAIDVLDKRITQRQPPCVHLYDLVNATARRVHFRA